MTSSFRNKLKHYVYPDTGKPLLLSYHLLFVLKFYFFLSGLSGRSNPLTKHRFHDLACPTPRELINNSHLFRYLETGHL